MERKKAQKKAKQDRQKEKRAEDAAREAEEREKNRFLALSDREKVKITNINFHNYLVSRLWGRKKNVSPYINHNAVYILFLVLWDQREYSEKSEINDWFRLIF